MKFTDSPFEKMIAQGLPVLRVPLLAGHRLCVLLPGAHAGPGWREVTAWPVN